MNNRITLLLTLLISAFGLQAQQLPNSSFETWGPFAPTGWTTYESIFGFPMGLGLRDTIDKIDLTTSIRLRSDSIPGFPAYGVFPGSVANGSGAAVGGPPTYYGAPFTYRPDTLTFSYKYSTPGNDTGKVTVRFRSSNTTILNATFALEPTNTWTTVSFELTSRYINNNIPDSARIQFTSSYGTPVKGSTLQIDKVHLGYVPVQATIATFDPTTFCEGGGAQLSANQGSGLTYQWLRNGTAINNATNATYTATESGNYTVAVSNGGAPDTSTGIAIMVRPNPTATLIVSTDTTCHDSNPVLIQFSPAGGTISGTGITNDTLFTPITAGVGTFVLTYVYADSNACVDTATQTIVVAEIPQAFFNAPASNCAYDPITFNNTSSPSATTWQWTFGDGGTSTDDEPEHTYTNPGSFNVILEVTSAAGCYDSVHREVTVSLCTTGIDEVAGNALSLYPNPAVNSIQLSGINTTTVAQVQILDVTGKVVLAKGFESNTIDVSNLTNGNYLLRLNNNTGQTVQQQKLNILK